MDQLDSQFHLVDQYVLPAGSFYLPSEGPDKKYNVPAVAQIWKRTETARQSTPVQPSTRYQFVKNPQDADFAFRRKGWRAGEIIVDDIENTNPNSFVYIKAGDSNVLRDFQAVDWKQCGNDVMGARSISQREIYSAVK